MCQKKGKVLKMKKRLGFRTKKILSWMMAGCLLLALAACGKEDTQGDSGLTAVVPGIENNGNEDSQGGAVSEDAEGLPDGEEGYFSEEYGEYFLGGLTYKLDAATKTAQATGLSSLENTEVVMPDVISYDGCEYKVTGVAESLFAYQANLTGVKLAAGLTEIPASMFYGCEKLVNVTIPDGVKKIGDNAFTQCFSLNSMELPASLESIGAEAFFGCEMLQQMVLPDSVSEIGNAAFYDCSLLRSVTLSKNLKAIPDEAFGNCVCLKEITIPDGVKEIGFEVFWGCSALNTVVIPDSVALIGSRCFYDCAGLQEVTLPMALTEADREMFAYCEALQTIHAPENLCEELNEMFALDEVEIVAR